MTGLEQIERDITALRESIRIAMRTVDDPGLCVAFMARRRASISLSQRYLAELLARREDLSAMSMN